MEAWRRSLKEADAKEKAKQERILAAKTANVKEMFRLNAINLKRKEAEERVLKEEEAKQLREALRAEELAKEKELAHTAERAAVRSLCVYYVLSVTLIRPHHVSRPTHAVIEATYPHSLSTDMCTGSQAVPSLFEKPLKPRGGG